MPEPNPVDMSEFLATPRNVGPCIVARSLNLLEDEDRVKFETAISMPEDSAPTNRIVQAFWARGMQISKDSISKHRRRQCCCVR